MIGFQLDEVYDILKKINVQYEEDNIYFVSIDEYEIKFKYSLVNFVVRYDISERPEIAIKIPFGEGYFVGFSNTLEEFEELMVDTLDRVGWDEDLHPSFNWIVR
jgi:hypothetical protein